MSKTVKIITLACLVVLTGMTLEAAAVGGKNVVYRNREGQFEFAVPEGWTEIPKAEVEKAGFLCGFEDQPGANSARSYVLVQIQRKKKPPEQDIQAYIASTPPLANITDMVQYIRDGRHLKRPEIYDRKHGIFFYIRDYKYQGKPSLSIMAKKFWVYGYVIFHFYLRHDLSEDIKDIKTIIDSFKIDTSDVSGNDLGQ